MGVAVHVRLFMGDIRLGAKLTLPQYSCAFVIEIFIISMLFVSLYSAHILWCLEHGHERSSARFSSSAIYTPSNLPIPVTPTVSYDTCITSSTYVPLCHMYQHINKKVLLLLAPICVQLSYRYSYARYEPDWLSKKRAKIIPGGFQTNTIQLHQEKPFLLIGAWAPNSNVMSD